MTFFPQFILGVLGMPRRYHIYLPEFQVWHVLSSAGASILAVAYLWPLFYLGWSLFYGRRAPKTPGGPPGWNGRRRRLRRRIISKVTPVVTRDPYQYTLKARGLRPQNA